MFEGNDFLWSPPTAGDIDWDECVREIKQQIVQSFPALASVDEDKIVLQDDEECDVDEGADLQGLLDDAESNEIVINVLVENTNNAPAAPKVPIDLYLSH